MSIKNISYEFVCIKNIIINKDYRGQGFFSNKILEPIINSKFNIFIDDIINDRLFDMLLKKGFYNLFYSKNNDNIRAVYLIKY